MRSCSLTLEIAHLLVLLVSEAFSTPEFALSASESSANETPMSQTYTAIVSTKVPSTCMKLSVSPIVEKYCSTGLMYHQNSEIDLVLSQILWLSR